MIKNEQAVKDILDMLSTGHRTTPGGRERRFLRRSRWEIVNDVNGTRVHDTWGRYDLLHWVVWGHQVLVNTDRTSAFYHHEIWRWLANWGLQGMPLSFAAAQLAGIQIQTIEPVVYQPAWTTEDMRTKRNKTPHHIRWAGSSYVRDREGRMQYRVRWHKPAEDGCFHWRQFHWHGRAEGVFEARWTRLNGRQAGQSLFLSGWDDQDHPARYFLAQLPALEKGLRPKTMDEAREILKPEAVKLAEEQGLRVIRQGDVFAIEVPEVTRKFLERFKQHGARFQHWRVGRFDKAWCACGDKHCYSYFKPRPAPGDVPNSVRNDIVHYMRTEHDGEDMREYASKLMIQGTVHTATEVITFPDGQQYVRGTLKHQPLLQLPARPRDHRDVHLDGGNWWMVVRNTVPPATA